jgi:hypothetical protein
MWHQTSGIPVEGFEPSHEGPPRAREDHPFVWQAGTYAGSPRPENRIVRYHPVTLPPIRLARRGRGGGFLATVLLGLTALLVAGVVLALVYQFGWFDLRTHSGASSPGAATVVATAAASSSICPRVSTDTLASPARIDQVQMTTGLQDSAHYDYRPVDNKTSFLPGERGYVTFRIATDQAGTVYVRFCLPTRMVDGTLAIPANSEGRFGEFEIHFTSEDIGPARAILYWGTLENGVGAIIDFTVSAT